MVLRVRQNFLSQNWTLDDDYNTGSKGDTGTRRQESINISGSSSELRRRTVDQGRRHCATPNGSHVEGKTQASCSSFSPAAVRFQALSGSGSEAEARALILGFVQHPDKFRKEIRRTTSSIATIIVFLVNAGPTSRTSMRHKYMGLWRRAQIPWNRERTPPSIYFRS
jgi:hypothetical protein